VHSEERRRFERLTLEDDAQVYAADDQHLGSVAEASGGGLQLRAVSAQVVQSLAPGQVLSIRVFEPRSMASTNMKVRVKHCEELNVGLEFVK
jgi:hypothetical protein